MNKQKLGIFLMVIGLLVCLLPTVLASQVYHVKLLAVNEAGGNYTGSTADLYLELRPGTGRVFLDTYPLTRMDTQLSTRFSKELACAHFELPCDRYDFIYTIRSGSSIIGGPSAGAAAAALATIAVKDLPYNQNIAITGTINSGGLIGPVGGLKDKISAGAKAGLTEILIATGSKNYTQDNISIDLEEHGTAVGTKVTEVQTLDDVIFIFTGKQLRDPVTTIELDPTYTKIMGQLRDNLCERTDKLAMQIIADENISLKREQAANATQKGDSYSAASFCFGANIDFKSAAYANFTQSQLEDIASKTRKHTQELEEQLQNVSITTISDLQTRIIVKERIQDVKRYLEEFSTSGEAYHVAYAEERLFSALAWTQFFTMNGQQLVIGQDQLVATCAQKIAESEERRQYVSLYLGDESLTAISKKIALARQAQTDGDYELCIITGAQAKADTNAILATFGQKESELGALVASKQAAAARVIAQNSAQGVFPILGYSYYQYAQSLVESEPFTALVFMEYSLEMSDLSLYFPTAGPSRFRLPPGWILLVEGFVLGVLLTLLGVFLYPKISRKKKTR